MHTKKERKDILRRTKKYGKVLKGKVYKICLHHLISVYKLGYAYIMIYKRFINYILLLLLSWWYLLYCFVWLLCVIALCDCFVWLLCVFIYFSISRTTRYDEFFKQKHQKNSKRYLQSMTKSIHVDHNQKNFDNDVWFNLHKLKQLIKIL